MRNFFRLCLVLIGTGTFGAQLTFTNLAQMLAAPVSASSPPANTSVSLLGRDTPGDGAGGEFTVRRDLDVTTAEYAAGTNFYGIYVPRTSGVVFERLYKSPINPRWFGAVGSTNYPTVEVQQEMQAAIDYSEISGFNNVDLTIGNRMLRYLLGAELQIKSTRFGGQKAQRGVQFVYQGTNAIGPPYGAILVESLHFEGDSMIKVIDDATEIAKGESGTALIENIYLRGNKAWNQKDPVEITAINATNRAVFFVDSANVPIGDGDRFGHVFFYDNTPMYMGAAIVTSVDGGTGQINLDTNFLAYASYNTAPGQLQVGWTAVFSPVMIEAARLEGQFEAVSEAYAGNAGISFVGSNTNNLNRYMRVQGCTIEGFHVGLRPGAVIFPEIENNFVRGCAFALVATPFPTAERDTFYGSRNYFSGFHTQDDFTTINPAIMDFLYSRTAYGMYNMASAGFGTQVTVDGTLVGYFMDTPLNSSWGLMRVDQPIVHGLWLGGGGFSGIERSESVIQVFTVLATSTANQPDNWRTPRSAIYTRPKAGTVNNVSIGIYNSVGSNEGTKFGTEFDIATGDVVEIGMLASFNGATNHYAPGSAAVLFGSAGSTRQLIGTHWYNPTPDTLALSVSKDKKIDIAGGTFGWDAEIGIQMWGADLAGTNRTDATTKIMEFHVSPYRALDQAVRAIQVTSSSTENVATIGNRFSTNGAMNIAELATTDRVLRIDDVGDGGADPYVTGLFFGNGPGGAVDFSMGRLKFTRPTNSIAGIAYVGATEPYFPTNAGVGTLITNTLILTNVMRVYGSAALSITNDGVNWEVDQNSTIYSGAITNAGSVGSTDVEDLNGGIIQVDFLGRSDTNYFVAFETEGLLASGHWIAGIDPEPGGERGTERFRVWTHDYNGSFPQSDGWLRILMIDVGNITNTFVSGSGGGGGFSTSTNTVIGVDDVGVEAPNFVSDGDVRLAVVDTNIFLYVKTNSIALTNLTAAVRESFAPVSHVHSGADITSGTVDTDRLETEVVIESELLSAISDARMRANNNPVTNAIDGLIVKLRVTNNVVSLDIDENSIPWTHLAHFTNASRLLGRNSLDVGEPEEIVMGGTEFITMEMDVNELIATLNSTNLAVLNRDTNIFAGTIVAGAVEADDFLVSTFSADSATVGELYIGTNNIMDLISTAGGGGSKTFAQLEPIQGYPTTNIAVLAPGILTFFGDGIAVMGFSDAATNCWDWRVRIPEGVDTTDGIVVHFEAIAEGTSGDTFLTVQFDNMGGNYNSDPLGAAHSATLTLNGTSGVPFRGSVTNTTLDGWSEREWGRVRACRNPINAADTASGYVYLSGLALEVP